MTMYGAPLTTASPLEPAAERLRAILNAKKAVLSKTDFATRVGWSMSWLRRVLQRAENAEGYSLPLEVLVATLRLPGIHPEAFAGTIEHEKLQQLPAAHRRFIEAVAAHNLKHEPDEGHIKRANVEEYFQKRGVKRPGAYWKRLLDGQAELPEDAETRTKLASILKVAPAELGVPASPEQPPEVLGRIAVDQLVHAKLANLRNGSRRWGDHEVKRRTREYLAEEVGAPWGELPEPTKEAITEVVKPIVAKMFALMDTRRRPSIGLTGGYPEAVVQAASEHLPVIDDAIEPAVKRLAERKPNGELVRGYASELQVSEMELAMLLLGLGSPERYPDTAAAIRRQLAPPRKPKKRRKGPVVKLNGRPEIAPHPMPKRDAGPFRPAWDLDTDTMVGIVRGILREAGRPMQNRELADLIMEQLGCGNTKAQDIIREARKYGALARRGARYVHPDLAAR